MLQRVAIGTLASAVLLAVMMLDALIAQRASESGSGELLMRGSVIPLLFTGIILAGALELGRLMQRAGLKPHMPWAAAMCAALMLSPWLCAGEVLGDGIVDVEALPWHVVWLLVAVLGAAVAHLARGASPSALADLGATGLIILYLGFLPSFAIMLRSDYNLADPAEGAWIVLIILVIAFATDIGALYTGLAIGRHRLAPSLSPNKSVEGAIGGVAASVLVALAIRWIALGLDGLGDQEPETAADRLHQLMSQVLALPARLDITSVVILAALISVFSQAGDLFESALKRSAQVKDSSGLIPGMGGILDVLDGAIFAVPVAWFLLTQWWEAV